MAKSGWGVNMKKAKARRFQNPPPGRYLLKITKVERSTSQSGKPLVRMVLAIVEGAEKGRKVTYNLNLGNEEQVGYTKAFLEDIGMPDAESPDDIRDAMFSADVSFDKNDFTRLRKIEPFDPEVEDDDEEDEDLEDGDEDDTDDEGEEDEDDEDDGDDEDDEDEDEEDEDPPPPPKVKPKKRTKKGTKQEKPARPAPKKAKSRKKS